MVTLHPKIQLKSLSDRTLVRLVRVMAGLLALSVLALAVYIYVDSTRSRDTLLDRELRQVEEQIRKQPADAELRVIAAELYLTRGLYDRAIAQAGQALQANDHHVDALMIMGLAYKEKGEMASALRYLEQVVAQNEGAEMARTSRKLAMIHYELGEIYLRIGDPEKAVAALQRALEVDRTDADAHRLLGQAYAAQGNPEEAVAAFRQALRFVPDYAEVYQSLQQIWERQGDGERVSFAGAMLSYSRGDLAVAEPALVRAAEALPEMVEARLGLGMVYEKMGLPDRAAEAYLEALKLDHKSYAARQALGRLGSQ